MEALSNYKPSLRIDDTVAKFMLDAAGETLPRLNAKSIVQLENIAKRIQNLAFAAYVATHYDLQLFMPAASTILVRNNQGMPRVTMRLPFPTFKGGEVPAQLGARLEMMSVPLNLASRP